MDMVELSVEERKEIIAYGLERGKVISLSYAIALLIGYSLGIIGQTIIFLLAFGSLRRYAGGYHADSQKRCYIISLLVVFLSLLYIRQIKCNLIIGFFIQTFNLLMIMSLSPVENTNRRLDDSEKKKYGNRTKITVILLYILYCLLRITKYIYIATPIAAACFIVNLSLTIGYIKNKKS